MSVDVPREIALKILYDINEKGAYTNIAVNKHLEANKLDHVDRAFVTELVYGTVKWKLTLDWIIQQFSKLKLKKVSPWIINILRLGVYQLLYTDRIPEQAVCNESVKLAKKYGHSASSGYVNAVLRNIARNKGNIRYPDKKLDIIRHLSVKYSHPEWLVEKWMGLFGDRFTEELLAANNEVPEFTVRTNTLKVTRERLIEILKEEGVKAYCGRYLEEAVVIENPSFALKTKAFEKGYFQVQDESSMLVSRILDPKPGEFVMDVCSAPGGKSTHIAQLMGNKGTVLARDIHDHKIKLIEEACKRLGTSIVKAEIWDAAEFDERYAEKADKVLVDVPCTGFGIIRRKPDIKWTRSPEETESIKHMQERILKTASQYVKPGGVLVYSTCTVNPEENEEMVKAFLSRDKSFELDDIVPLLPEKLREKVFSGGYIQLFPHIDNVDGFFIARMKKVKHSG